MQPRNRSLAKPTKHAQAAAVRFVSFRQVWLDVSIAKLLAVWFRIIRSIAIEFARVLGTRAWLAANCRRFIHQGQQLCGVMPVGTRQRGFQGNAAGIGEHVVLAPELAAISRVWSGFFASSHRTHRTAVDSAAGQIELAGCPQLVEQQTVQPIPYSALLPVAE